MRFESPWFLLFLLFIPIYWWIKYAQSGKLTLNPTVLFSSLALFSKKDSRTARFLEIGKDLLLSLSLLFLIIALARPQGGKSIQTDKGFGIDIILAMDVSGSMLYVDSLPSNIPSRNIMGTRVYYDSGRKLLSQNRLNSAKRVIQSYIERQTFNRIGMVLFAGYSYTKCPLTLDKEMLGKLLSEVHYDAQNDGTAIGMGIATSVNRLKKSTAKSKVIILLTDGVNNSGLIDPISASKIAREMHIRIYTIGLGNPNGFLAPASKNMREYIMQTGTAIDEPTLKQIASITGGRFYRARDPLALKNIYNDIDKLEKSKIEIKHRVLYRENFYPFLALGFLFLALTVLTSAFVLKIP